MENEFNHMVSSLTLIGAFLATKEEKELMKNQTGLDWSPKEDGTHLLNAWKLAGDILGAGENLDLRQRETLDAIRAEASAKQMHHAVWGFDEIEALKKTKTPCLILCSEDDVMYPFLNKAKACRSDAIVEIIQGKNLEPDLDAKNISNLLMEFLKKFNMENQMAKKAEQILSWLGFSLFSIVFINMLQAPRITIGSEEREIMRNFHIVAGTFLMAISMFRCIYGYTFHLRRIIAYCLSRIIHSFIFYNFFFTVHSLHKASVAFLWLGLTVPIRFMKGVDTIDHGLWTISGYLHSAFGFLYIMLILIILILRLYHMFDTAFSV